MKHTSRMSFLILFFAFFFTCLAGSALAQNNPVPFVNQPLIPVGAMPGSPAFTLTVNGTGFVAGGVVNWNGSPRPTTVISSSQVTAAISPADVAKVGTASVTVSNPAPGGGSSNVATFSVRRPLGAVPLAPDQQPLEPGSVAVGDFNRDGKLDLLVANPDIDDTNLGTLDFYAGNGNGTFAPPIRTTVAGTGPIVSVNLLVADFNADATPDVAFNTFDGDGNAPPKGIVLFGNGDGTFTQPVPDTDYNFNAVAVGDLNGDGLPDFITAGENPSDFAPTTSVYLAGAGFSYTVSQSFFFSCNGGSAAVLGDFNGDGKLDIAFNADFQSCGYSGVWVALGNGDGTFQSQVLYSTTYPVAQVIAADLDGDGKLDLVTDGICVLLGNGDGTFRQGGCRNANSFQFRLSMVLGDFNGDGMLDLAMQYSPGGVNGIYVFPGNGKGQFATPLSYAIPNNVGGGLSAGDFNGDGRLDFALSGAAPSNATVFLQTVASVVPNSLTFGVQLIGTSSSQQTVVFTNDQPFPLTLGGIQVTGVNHKEFVQTNNCGSSLAAHGSCQIQVTFAPKVAGIKAASLQVGYQGTGGPQSVPLSGTATAVKLTPTTINFGNQQVGTTSPPMRAILRNLGQTPLSISSIFMAGLDTPNFSQANNCGTSLAAGASCTIAVRFTPNAKRQFSSVVVINDSDPISQSFIVLNGTGT